MVEKVTLLQEQLANIVGGGNVITVPKALGKYSRDQSFVQPAMPLCVVMAETPEEVQSIIKVCNNHKVPVTPYTTGFNTREIPRKNTKTQI